MTDWNGQDRPTILRPGEQCDLCGRKLEPKDDAERHTTEDCIKHLRARLDALEKRGGRE